MYETDALVGAHLRVIIRATMKRLLLSLLFTLLLSVATVGQQKSDLVGSYLSHFEFGGIRINLKEDGTYVLHSSNCTSVITDTGRYSVANGVLSLNPQKETFRSFEDNKEHDVITRKARRKYLDTDEPFVPETEYFQIVRWGERVYLFNANSFGGFVDAINLGFEPRDSDGYRPYYGNYLLREGDEKKPVDGPPPLKKELLDLLLPAPVIATVIKVETIGNDTLATIDRGSDDGLRKEMSLVTADSESYYYEPHMVVEVEPHYSKVKIWKTIKVGDKLTTRVADPKRFG
jgi:hypothetical protein